MNSKDILKIELKENHNNIIIVMENHIMRIVGCDRHTANLVVNDVLELSRLAENINENTENEDTIIYSDKVKEHLLSEEPPISDIELFLGYPISLDVLEKLEKHIDEVITRMSNEAIREYYDLFFG